MAALPNEGPPLSLGQAWFPEVTREPLPDGWVERRERHCAILRSSVLVADDTGRKQGRLAQNFTRDTKCQAHCHILGFGAMFTLIFSGSSPVFPL